MLGCTSLRRQTRRAWEAAGLAADHARSQVRQDTRRAGRAFRRGRSDLRHRLDRRSAAASGVVLQPPGASGCRRADRRSTLAGARRGALGRGTRKHLAANYLQIPNFGEYQQKTLRVLPVVRLARSGDLILTTRRVRTSFGAGNRTRVRRRRGALSPATPRAPAAHRAGNASFTSVPRILRHCASNSGSSAPMYP